MNLKVVTVFQKVPATEMVVQNIQSQLQVSLIGEDELTSAAVVQQLSWFRTLLAKQGHLNKK